MENLCDYLTAKGWKADWEKTKEDFFGCRKELSDFAMDENGGAAMMPLLMAAGVSLMAIGAALGYNGREDASICCYLGAGVSYTIGMLSIMPGKEKKK